MVQYDVQICDSNSIKVPSNLIYFTNVLRSGKLKDFLVYLGITTCSTCVCFLRCGGSCSNQSFVDSYAFGEFGETGIQPAKWFRNDVYFYRIIVPHFRVSN